jgi:hypothetical protein
MYKARLFLAHLVLAISLLLPFGARAGAIDAFVGSYEGTAEFEFNNKIERRDMSTTIEAGDDGFIVGWTSVSYRSDGRTKTKSYTIEFSPSERDHIYKSAMKKNLFGKATPLDPLRGEPFVWARFEGETLSVFSLFINEVGGYEVQEFHRSLAPGGLDLVFQRVHNGERQKEIRTLLKRIK